MAPRKATHAGSWYTGNGGQLNKELEEWLGKVSSTVDAVEDGNSDKSTTAMPVPIKECRAIIGPHAGYSYSGPNAAFAYKCINTEKVKRVFLLGPSHHVYLESCALSTCDEYETPLGNIKIDQAMNRELKNKGTWKTMNQVVDEDEHSLEMHLPYIYKVFEDKISEIKLVPIMVGNLSFEREKYYGKLLAKYLASEENFFVISSDFCHWGSRFRFTHYESGTDTGPVNLSSARPLPKNGVPIWQSIERLDKRGMCTISSLDHGAFKRYLDETENTICGRHPIGVLLAAVDVLCPQKDGPVLRFVKYDQSSKVVVPSDSSVSYASAYLSLPASTLDD